MAKPSQIGSAAEQRKQSFPPVVDPDVSVLILGSLPGEQSLARQRYYAHQRNQFWALMSRVVEADLVILDYPERLRTLLQSHVGLWDVIGSASRPGSLDASIRAHRPNGLAELAASLPRLRAVGFNGGTSARLGTPLLQDGGYALVPLPSSSPAYTLRFEAKLDQWLKLRGYL